MQLLLPGLHESLSPHCFILSFPCLPPSQFNLLVLISRCRVRWSITLWKFCLATAMELANIWMNLGMQYLDIKWGADVVPWGELKEQGLGSAYKQNRHYKIAFDLMYCLPLRSDHEDCDMDFEKLWKSSKSGKEVSNCVLNVEEFLFGLFPCSRALNSRSWFQLFFRRNMTWRCLESICPVWRNVIGSKTMRENCASLKPSLQRGG